MDRQILEAVRNEHDNYILPFLWMKGEQEDIIRREIDRIHSEMNMTTIFFLSCG